jgi:mannose-6-phosphate isomerase-like protein (cupin superfamily)
MNSPEVRRAKPTVEFLPVELDGSHVGILSVESPGVRDEWEMHPEQDELLYLLRGAVDVFLRVDLEGTEDQAIYFLKGDACLIPKGMVAQTSRCPPCKMLLLTPKTMHQPYVPESGWAVS